VAVGWTHNLAVSVGPVADGIILNSRRRLLDCLTAGDADGAAHEMERHLSGLCFMSRVAERCAS
jgi:DNA-binding FadR family transcriptional regulator